MAFIPMSHTAPAASASEARATPRQRLPADTRIHQILDAALQAFVQEGYTGTRIDDIASRAGLSKGGIYTHFKSKEDIFEALLNRTLCPMEGGGPVCQPGEGVTVDTVIERVLDRMYDAFNDPQKRLTLRLLLSDGARVKEHVARWRQAVLDPYLVAIEALVQQGVAQGTLRDSVVKQSPWLLLAPGVFAAMWQLALDDNPHDALAAQRKAHAAMLRELLAPPSLPPDPSLPTWPSATS
jgi:AcrR family transcriptional regulator